MKRLTAAPIIAFSALPAAALAVDVLDAGADDYLVAPFDMDELLARLRVVLRRGAARPVNTTISTRDFEVNLEARQITRLDGESIRLTPTEWQMVDLLIRESPNLVTHRQMLREVWGPDFLDRSNYLRVYMTGLRRKLEPYPAKPRYFITVPGLGHRFVNSSIGAEAAGPTEM